MFNQKKFERLSSELENKCKLTLKDTVEYLELLESRKLFSYGGEA